MAPTTTHPGVSQNLSPNPPRQQDRPAGTPAGAGVPTRPAPSGGRGFWTRGRKITAGLIALIAVIRSVSGGSSETGERPPPKPPGFMCVSHTRSPATLGFSLSVPNSWVRLPAESLSASAPGG